MVILNKLEIIYNFKIKKKNINTFKLQQWKFYILLEDPKRVVHLKVHIFCIKHSKPQCRSQIINDEIIKEEILKNNIDTSISTINNTFVKQILSKLFILTEKLMKTIVLPSKRSTFTFGLIGFDLSKLKEIKKADIIHIHWLKDGFINFKTISKIKKPVVWTMRDMWPFTGGSTTQLILKIMKMENFLKE